MNKIQIIQGDITAGRVDAIVNAANTTLLGGGGVDGAIHRAAGPELFRACLKFNGCPTGEARITPGFQLPANYVIHTPGPIWRGGQFQEAPLLAACYRNSLRLADQSQCQTVDFPSISTGVYAFPLEQAAQIALQTLETELQMTLFVHRVRIVGYDAHTTEVYQTCLNRMISSDR
ncbi:O-acetyl-ADP-ribose deacetylase [Levilactobacillus bambusae]|uniref:O-acetyl-ADP-ribose deacetylase n=1 Tax=Levilactobacillus bambusae TaxID=2024736 RepID=A0A2V1MYJ4_9LACO|nr:O-acetyl-ADP-ribose deacetylase [Levilactobacillus bambusae]PWG00081.1 O-acetyl-ADP-ribose deacetylase [Levilactobacillus bambusae]